MVFKQFKYLQNMAFIKRNRLSLFITLKSLLLASPIYFREHDGHQINSIWSLLSSSQKLTMGRKKNLLSPHLLIVSVKTGAARCKKSNSQILLRQDRIILQIFLLLKNFYQIYQGLML